MKSWQQLRIILLATLCMSASVVLGKTIVFPSSRDRSIPVFEFPAAIPVSGWQFRSSYPFTNPKSPGLVSSVDEQTIAGRFYQYTRNGIPIDIEMRYFSNSYIDVASILRETSLTVKKPVLVVHRQGVSSYALFDQRDRTYLSACISAFGSSVSEQQFRQNQNDLKELSNRLLPWLLGQTSLRDLRCLWVSLSIPATKPPQVLKEAWGEWYPMWHRSFR